MLCDCLASVRTPTQPCTTNTQCQHHQHPHPCRTTGQFITNLHSERENNGTFSAFCSRNINPFVCCLPYLFFPAVEEADQGKQRERNKIPSESHTHTHTGVLTYTHIHFPQSHLFSSPPLPLTPPPLHSPHPLPPTPLPFPSLSHARFI